MEPSTVQSSIELSISRKGYYFWSIHLSFDKFTETPESVISQIAEIDRSLRDKYPKNLAQQILNTSGFKGIDALDED